jgi:hypothetical protein
MNSRDKSAQPIESTQSEGGTPLVSDGRFTMPNPYSPAKEVEIDEPHQEPVDTTDWTVQLQLVQRAAVRWTLVCGIAAAPSFVVGMWVTQGEAFGMFVAVLTFIGFYIAGDLISRHWPIRRHVAVRRTLVFVYVTRIVISIVFPVGIYIDIFTGAGMLALLDITARGVQQNDFTIGNGAAKFWLAYRMTFVHAILMNIVLAIYGVLLLPFVIFFTRLQGSKGEPIPSSDVS